MYKMNMTEGARTLGLLLTALFTLYILKSMMEDETLPIGMRSISLTLLKSWMDKNG